MAHADDARSWPSSLGAAHRSFLRHALDTFSGDARIVGVGAGGSFLTDTMDEFSDLDLVVVTEASAHERVLRDSPIIAKELGPLLAAFTGEHVGEPRLLICFYDGSPPLHVDLKFVALGTLDRRVEDPAVLWEREGRVTGELAQSTAEYPVPDRQWIEDRFWVWIHYAATKLGRGELFETVEFLSALRNLALGPLALMSVGARPSGVRRLESLAPHYASRLQATIATYDARDCGRALRACVDTYRALRAEGGALERREAAEAAATRYLDEVERR